MPKVTFECEAKIFRILESMEDALIIKPVDTFINDALLNFIGDLLDEIEKDEMEQS